MKTTTVLLVVSAMFLASQAFAQNSETRSTNPAAIAWVLGGLFGAGYGVYAIGKAIFSKKK